MKEVQAIAVADSYELTDDFISGMHEESKGMPIYTSMMRHYDAHSHPRTSERRQRLASHQESCLQGRSNSAAVLSCTQRGR